MFAPMSRTIEPSVRQEQSREITRLSYSPVHTGQISVRLRTSRIILFPSRMVTVTIDDSSSSGLVSNRVSLAPIEALPRNWGSFREHTANPSLIRARIIGVPFSVGVQVILER